MVESIADSLRRVLYFPQTVVSGRFSARIVTGAPCLDQRFLSLALQNDRQWSVADSAARECDALFFIDYNQSMAGALKTLGKGGIVVFCGETPCGGEGKTVVTPATFSLVAYQPYDSLFRQFGAVDLPPPSHVFGCPSPFLVRPRPVLGCRFDVSGRKDTLPFLSVGTFENHGAIVIAGSELWRMDFWPLSVARQSETASFLQYAAAFVKQLLVLNCSRNFFVYPSAQEQYENDPLPFSVLLPSDFNDVPLLKGCSVGFTLDSLSRIVLSTGPIPVDFKEPLRGTVVLPPLRAGTYHYRCSIAAQGVKREFDDSLYVDVNREEMSVAGQNTALLDQVGLPLGANTVQSVLDAYAGASVSKQYTVIDTFEIRKSWPLLFVIILLLTIEWVVRRRQELE
jgi:hypothetical protein